MDGGNASTMHTTLRPWVRDIDWFFEKGIISNKACRNGHWIWTPVTDKELTWLFKNKWNIYKWSEGKKLHWVSSRFKLLRVWPSSETQGQIVGTRESLNGQKNIYGVWLTEGKITVNVHVFMKEIKGKSTLARVNSARLE